MNNRTVDRRKVWAIKDLIIIALLALVGFGLATFFHATERLITLARAHEQLNSDALAITLAILVFGCGIAAWRRLIDLRGAIADRARAEAALLENEHQYRALMVAAQRQTQELELLERVRTVLARELDLPVACQAIVEAIAATFGYTQVSLYLLHDDTLQLQHQVGYNRVITHVPVTEGISGRVVRTGKPVLLEDVRTDPAFLGAIDGIAAEICVPLFDQNHVAGVLNVESTTVGRLSDADLQLMVALGEHVGTAIGRARLYQEARDSEDRFRQLSGATLEGIVVHDQGFIIDANQAFAAMFGQPAAEIIGRNAFAFIAPESHARIRQHIQAQFEEPYEALGLKADGSTFPIEIQGRVIPYQGRLLRVTAVRDISARKRVDEELQRRLRETLLLNRVIAAAASVLEPNAVLEIVCTELAGAFDLPQAAAALLDADQSQLTVVAEYCAAGRPSGLGAVIPVANNQATQYVLKQRAPLTIMDAQNDPRQTVIHDLEQRRGTVSLLIVPLVIRDQVVGTLGLDTIERREWSAEEIALAQNVASAASRALENAYLYAAVQQELTERHQAQQALQAERDLIAAVLDTVGALVVVFDRDGRIVRFNRACESTTGYAFEEVCDRLFWDLFVAPEELEPVKAVFAKLCAGDFPSTSENDWVARDGGRRLIAWSNAALTDNTGAVEYVIATGIDITERKQIDRMKNEFIATVSHELRTPLTSIRGALSLVINGVAGALPAAAQAMLAIAHQNSERLVGLVNNILDIEKIESGNIVLVLAPVDLMRLVEQALDANAAYAQQFDVTFRIEQAVPHAQINVDGNSMIQVLTNLLSNAAKFSPPGEIVRVAVTRNDGVVRVAISDCGPGIPEAFHPHMFQKFAQADASNTRQKGSTGLGLSIAKALVEQMGGWIGFETAGGVGTTFSIDLPEWHAQPEGMPTPIVLLDSLPPAGRAKEPRKG